MEYYGDISGDFRNLLREYCDVVVIGVVKGSEPDCYRCAKRAVRRVGNMNEARWNDLPSWTEKRRFFECFDENCPPLEFGYASFTREDFHSLENYHHLYQDVVFPPAWDLSIRAHAYTEILMEMGGVDERATLHFDRFKSNNQSDEIASKIEEILPQVDANYHSSQQKLGIQSADCLAGGIAEMELGGEPWLDYISEKGSVTDCKHWAVIQLENDLADV